MKYIDTNVFVYKMENNPDYGPSCDTILRDIQEKKIKAASSMLTFVEIMHVTQKLSKLAKLSNANEKIKETVDLLLAYPIAWLDMQIPIIQAAASDTTNLRAADRIHLATMKLHGITEIISADMDFDNIPGIKRIGPREYKATK